MKKHIFALLTMTFALFGANIQASDCCYDVENLYVGGFGGVDFLQNIHDRHDLVVKAKTGYIVGAAIGYKIENIVRVEAEFAYRNHTVKTVRNAYGIKLHPYKPKIETFSYMANAYYDFDFLNCDITPYIGAGLGYAQSKSTVRRYGFDISEKESGFAYQVIGGANYKLCEKTFVGLEYRFFAAKKDVKDHSIAVNLKRYF